MKSQLEQLPSFLKEGQTHQLWFLPSFRGTHKQAIEEAQILDDTEKQENLVVDIELPFRLPFREENSKSTSLRIKSIKMLPTQELQRDNAQLASRDLLWEVDAFDLDTDPELDRRTTLPMLVLKGVSEQQKQVVPVMRSEISGAASGAVYVGIGAIASYFFKYGNTFLMQRGLGVESFGLYSIGMSVVTLIVSILTLGLDDVMVRYIAIYRHKKQVSLLRGVAIFCSAIAGIAGILGAFCMILFAPFLAAYRHTDDLTSILQIMAPLIPLLCIQAVFVGGLQGFKEFKKRVLSQRVFVPTISFLMLAGTLLFFHSVNGVTVVALITTAISTILSLYYLLQTLSQMIKPEPEAYEVREWLSFAILNFLTTVIDVILDAIDTLLLTFFAISDAAIGQYNAAIKISSFIALPLTSLNTMFAPTIAELHSQGEKEKLDSMFKIVTKWAITFTLPIFGIATLFSASLLGLSGSDYVGAWPLLVIFAIGGLVNVATGPVGFMLLMTGHQKYSFFNSVVAIAANILLGLILTPRYGVMGTAISTGIATCVVNLMRLLQVILLLRMQPYRWDVLKPIGAGVISAALIGALLYLLKMTQWTVEIFHISFPLNLTLLPLFVIVYVGLLVVFKTSPEDKIVLTALHKKLSRGKK